MRYSEKRTAFYFGLHELHATAATLDFLRPRTRAELNMPNLHWRGYTARSASCREGNRSDTHLRSNVGRVGARQEDTRSGNLHGLSRTANGRGRAKLLKRLLGHGGSDERSPDRSRADSVDADALLLDDLIRQCAGETHDSPFSGGVVEQSRVSNEGVLMSAPDSFVRHQTHTIEALLMMELPQGIKGNRARVT